MSEVLQAAISAAKTVIAIRIGWEKEQSGGGLFDRPWKVCGRHV